MNRSPLFYPMNRSADGDAGGAADLQTDVMRFMAILSLCLVAIFALVHSIPTEERPVKDTPVEPVVAEVPEQPVPEQPARLTEIIEQSPPPPVTEVVDADDIDLQFPTVPKRVPVPDADPVEEPVPKPASTVAETTEPPAEPPAPPVEGFSLRFEDDLALTRLVARNEIGMYAVSADKSMRMNINRGDIGFWAASTPKQFHEMEASTVPEPVLNAYRYKGDAQSVKWGVTLPPAMTRQLNEYLNAHSGGEIVIEANGDMRLEQ